MLIVETDKAAVDTGLRTGRLSCPDCAGTLRPWGHSVDREVRLLSSSERRRFRRSICRSCRVTHVLIPEDTLVRRRHAVEVIGAALVAMAKGSGHRPIAVDLGIAPSTVRGWLRRFSAMASGIRDHFVRWAHAVDPGHDDLSPGSSTVSDAVSAIGVLGIVAVRRFGPRPVWSLASVVTGGGLMCNTSSPWAAPV